MTHLSLSLSLGSGGLTYNAPAQAFFARIPAQTNARKALYNSFFQSLIVAGVLPKLEILYLLAAADSTTAVANLVSSSFTATPVNSPTFTVDRGYAGNGSTSYLNTGWIPSASSIYTQNSASAGGYINAGSTTASDNRVMLGCSSTTNILSIAPRSTAGTVRGAINDGTGDNYNATTTPLGFTALSRTASNVKTAYKNGLPDGSSSTASTGRPTVSMFICGRSSSGTLSSPTDNQIAMVFAGAALSDAETLALYNATFTYLSAIGAQ